MGEVGPILIFLIKGDVMDKYIDDLFRKYQHRPWISAILLSAIIVVSLFVGVCFVAFIYWTASINLILAIIVNFILLVVIIRLLLS